jgi:hypothetical protein
MQLIGDLEGVGRGAYTGAMGYLGQDGSLDLNILIRTMTVHDGEIELRAGAGIVAASDPVRELEETRAKARGLSARWDFGMKRLFVNGKAGDDRCARSRPAIWRWALRDDRRCGWPAALSRLASRAACRWRAPPRISALDQVGLRTEIQGAIAEPKSVVKLILTRGTVRAAIARPAMQSPRESSRHSTGLDYPAPPGPPVFAGWCRTRLGRNASPRRSQAPQPARTGTARAEWEDGRWTRA